MAETPWWAIPLVAALFAVGGAVAALVVVAGGERARQAQERGHRWYTDRLGAYVALLAAFQRSVARLRRGFADGVPAPDLLIYLDEVGPALMRVRLLASLPVRNSALAVHRLIEGLHQPPAPGAPEREFLDRLAHVPLVMQAFEAAVRTELRIDPAGDGPPVRAVGPGSGLDRLLRRAPAGDQAEQPAGQRAD